MRQLLRAASLSALVATVSFGNAQALVTEAGQQARGAALFHGTPALPARLRHQDLALPPLASRCSNCHLGDSRQAALGPRLDANWLLGMRPRHGGPATRYERDSFCRLLRTGIAPADIVVAQAMPTYRIDDAQCDALWRHLTRPGPTAATQPTLATTPP